MTEQEYRAHPAVSRSELWRIRESPQKFMYAKENPAPPTEALLFGQAFHKLALEGETFFADFAVLPKTDRRTKSGKEEYSRFLEDATGKTIITHDMYMQAFEMCESLMAEPLAVKLLSGQKEVPFFWKEERTGELCKCRADCLNENYSQPIIVDLKSTENASSEAFIRSAINYGYDFQAAMYSDGVEHNVLQKPLFVFIAVEKNPPYAVNILQADELLLRRGDNLFRQYIDIYHDCKLTGNWYGYLGKKNQINNLALPIWAAREVE